MPGVLVGGTVFYAHPAAVDVGSHPRYAMLAHDGIKDTLDGGPGEIRGDLPSGLTTFDGVPGHAKVRLLDRVSLRVIRGTRSAADGTYRLTNLRLGVDYLVLGIDENDQDNAVVMDRVRAGIPD